MSRIEIDHYTIEIIPKSDEDPGKHEDDHHHDHDHHVESQSEYEDFDLFKLPVLVQARDNVTL